MAKKKQHQAPERKQIVIEPKDYMSPEEKKAKRIERLKKSLRFRKRDGVAAIIGLIVFGTMFVIFAIRGGTTVEDETVTDNIENTVSIVVPLNEKQE